MKTLKISSTGNGYILNVWKNKDEIEKYILDFKLKYIKKLANNEITLDEYKQTVNYILKRNIFINDLIYEIITV